MIVPDKTFSNKHYLLLGLCVLVNISGLWVTIIGPDGALYAGIAKHMVVTNNYIELFGEGKEWLDKPHFPFWITAFSFKLFGFTSWAYKLPAILFVLMCAGYTRAFARQLYNKTIAYWSVIVLLTAEHIIISNNDVRAEPYLTGLIIAAVYHFYQANRLKKFVHLLLGSLFAACAVMTKGLFVLIPVAGAIAGELVIKKQWKELFNIRWLLAALLVFIFIIPELYSLYYQFDAHPEKVVFGRTGVSGLRFFFWDSQFGRFFNTGPIKGKGDYFFFLHTLLWAFLPWSLLLYAAVFQKIKKGIKNFRQQEWYTLTGALLCFLVFSVSGFQLPHYTNIIFPFFAIITTAYLFSIERNAVTRLVNRIQTSVIILLLLLMIALQLFFQPGYTRVLVLLLAAGIACWFNFYPFIKRKGILPSLVNAALAVIIVNLYLNIVFYPALLKYQAGSEAAFYINKHFPGMPVVQLRKNWSYELEFYLDRPLITIDSVPELQRLPQPLLMYAPATVEGMPGASIAQTFNHFPVSRLTLKFISPASRGKELDKFHLYSLE